MTTSPPSKARRSAPARSPRARRYVLEAVALWIGAAFLLHLVYEAVDAFWLSRLSAAGQQTAGLLRHVAVAVTATVSTAVYVFVRAVPSIGDRRSPSWLPAESGTAESVGVAAWLVGLRWIALFALVPIVLAATVGGHVPVYAIAPLWGAVCSLLAFNTALMFVRRDRVVTTFWITIQVFFDTIVLAYVLHVAGGLTNPFAAFFAFHAVIAALVLEARLARRLAAAIAGLIALLTIVEATGLAPPGCLRTLPGACVPPDPLHLAAAGLALAILVLGTSAFTVTLVERLRAEGKDHERARQALSVEQEKLRSILECMADAVVFANPLGDIVLQNKAAEALWPGAPPAPDLRVCHDQATWDRLLRVLSNPAASEHHPRLEVGGRVYEATYGRVRGRGDVLRGVVMVARDVTEREHAQAWRMREERMSVVGKLAATLAHELNNPLGAIVLYSQHALRKLPEDHPLREHVVTIARNAAVCKTTVKDLLGYARQRPPERSSTRLDQLLEGTARTLAPAAERTGVALRVQADPRARELRADPQQLGQVLMNLGLNAIEAMPGGGEVWLEARREGDDQVVVEVRDSGPGISAEAMPKLFDPFFTTKSEGTGLGLAVVQDVVRAHGGRVEADNAPGGGARFRIWLPRGGAEEEAAQ